jgi:hypothetical protein
VVTAPPKREPRQAPFANNPQQQAAAVQRFKAGLLFENFPFYRTMALDEKKTARLEDILAEHQGRVRDLQLTVQERGLTRSDPAVAALQREETERFENELGDLLGEEGRKQFAAFQSGAADRRALAEVAGNLALTAEPLTAAQAQQLKALFQEVRFRSRRAEPVMWDELLQRSQGFLSSGQTAELRAMGINSQRENAMNALSKLVERARK